MKLAVLIGLAALVSTALSVPASSQEETPNEDQYVDEIKKYFADHNLGNGEDGKASSETDGSLSKKFANEMKEYILNSMLAMQESEDSGEKFQGEIQDRFQHNSQMSQAMDETEDEKTSEKYMDEVEKYFQHASSQSYDNAVMQDTKRAINSGDTVALQTFVRDHWLGCAGPHCGRASCPRMIFSGQDWNNCYGEVFEIYRAAGPGNVRVGDLVGLHYPRERGAWLGCPADKCAKATCPGHPTIQFGFANEEKWFHCYGEVFKIYAGDKPVGTAINEFDDIFLYYLRGQLWVAQGFDHTIRLPCVGQQRPPPASTYDHCPYETFKIWKRE